MTENGGRKGEAALLLALASGQKVRDAAQAAGIGERTATRRVAELRAGMVERALGKMAAGMGDAADTLRSLPTAEGESVRLGACRALLELGCRLRESVELEGRLAVLEAAQPLPRRTA